MFLLDHIHTEIIKHQFIEIYWEKTLAMPEQNIFMLETFRTDNLTS